MSLDPGSRASWMQTRVPVVAARIVAKHSHDKGRNMEVVLKRRLRICAAITVLCWTQIAGGQAVNPDLSKDIHSLQNKFGISVTFEPKTGVYTVDYKQGSWFGPGIVSVLVNRRWYRSSSLSFPEAKAYEGPQGKLLLADLKQTAASDQLGAYDSLEVLWKVPGTSVEVATAFSLYRDAPYLVFKQRFPNGFKNYASGNWVIPSVAFPQFVGTFFARNDIYSWTSGGMFNHRFAYGNPSSLGGTVDLLLLADKDYETVILSPFANYLVATQQSLPVASQDETNPAKLAITCGVEGLVGEIPSGFQHAHIMVAGEGIGDTFRAWGEALLDRAGKKIPSKYEGDTLKHLVYWDDYGAYYREHGFKEDGYKSYEDIIVGIAEDAKKHGLRIGAYQVQDLDQLRYQEGLFLEIGRASCRERV